MVAHHHAACLRPICFSGRAQDGESPVTSAAVQHELGKQHIESHGKTGEQGHSDCRKDYKNDGLHCQFLAAPPVANRIHQDTGLDLLACAGDSSLAMQIYYIARDFSLMN